MTAAQARRLDGLLQTLVRLDLDEASCVDHLGQAIDLAEDLQNVAQLDRSLQTGEELLRGPLAAE